MEPLRLQIAGFSPDFYCEDQGLHDYLKRELEPFLAAGDDGERVTIDFEWVETFPLAGEKPGELRFLLPGNTEILIEENSVNEFLGLRILGHANGAADSSSRSFLYSFILNYVLSLYLQMKNHAVKAHLMIVHACGAIYQGASYLFSGTSGVGKSTLARILSEEGVAEILGDDMIILSHDQSGWLAHGSPLGGDFPRSKLANTSAPLETIFFLTQSLETSWQRLSAPEALSMLISCVVPAHPLKHSALQKLAEYDSESIGLLMNDASLLAEDIPCFRLGLSLEQRLWKQIFNANMGRLVNG